jgi:hypothetical protein
MKQLTLIFSLLLFAGASCKKMPTSHFGNTVYSGKIVNSICGSITVQCTSDETLGQMNWTDASDPDRKVYNNVFKVANPCTWGKNSASKNIQFKMVAPSTQNCVQCMALGATPDVAYSIQVIE